MAKYIKRCDVWKMTNEELAKLQPGQHIYAGDPSSKGVWCGIKMPSETLVAMWEGNAKGRDRLQYMRDLIKYAK